MTTNWKRTVRGGYWKSPYGKNIQSLRWCHCEWWFRKRIRSHFGSSGPQRRVGSMHRKEVQARQEGILRLFWRRVYLPSAQGEFVVCGADIWTPRRTRLVRARGQTVQAPERCWSHARRWSIEGHQGARPPSVGTAHHCVAGCNPGCWDIVNRKLHLTQGRIRNIDWMASTGEDQAFSTHDVMSKDFGCLEREKNMVESAAALDCVSYDPWTPQVAWLQHLGETWSGCVHLDANRWWLRYHEDNGQGEKDNGRCHAGWRRMEPLLAGLGSQLYGPGHHLKDEEPNAREP